MHLYIIREFQQSQGLSSLGRYFYSFSTLADVIPISHYILSHKSAVARAAVVATAAAALVAVVAAAAAATGAAWRKVHRLKNHC